MSVGHEQAFKHGWPDGTLRISKTSYQGEVSWYGAPFLRVLDMPTAHQVRHPLLNIRTLVGMEHWRANLKDHGHTWKRYTPRVFDYSDPVLWSARFWLDWNRLCEIADVRWSVHELTWETLDSFIRNADIIHVPQWQLEEVVARIPTDPQTHNYSYELDWGDLGELGGEVMERAVEYGLSERAGDG